MAIPVSSSLVHWNYFLTLEKDLELISRYIEFEEENFMCYSIELARLLMIASSEVEVVAKQLCKKINPDSKASKLKHCKKIIIESYPLIVSFQALIPKFGLNELTPWINWKESNGEPDWFAAYNKVKHHRDKLYKEANLKNVINSVAGLFILLLYFYKEKAENAELLPIPSFLRVKEDHFGGVIINENGMGFHYVF